MTISHTPTSGIPPLPENLSPAELGKRISEAVKEIEAKEHIPTVDELYEQYQRALAAGTPLDRHLLDQLTEAAAQQVLERTHGTVLEKLSQTPGDMAAEFTRTRVMGLLHEMDTPAKQAEAIQIQGKGVTGDQTHGTQKGAAIG